MAHVIQLVIVRNLLRAAYMQCARKYIGITCTMHGPFPCACVWTCGVWVPVRTYRVRARAQRRLVRRRRASVLIGLPESIYAESAQPRIAFRVWGYPFFCGGGEKICSRMREIPRELGYAWIFSVYLLVVFRYIPAYVQRMMAESDVCGCCCL